MTDPEITSKISEIAAKMRDNSDEANKKVVALNKELYDFIDTFIKDNHIIGAAVSYKFSYSSPTKKYYIINGHNSIVFHCTEVTLTNDNNHISIDVREDSAIYIEDFFTNENDWFLASKKEVQSYIDTFKNFDIDIFN